VKNQKAEHAQLIKFSEFGDKSTTLKCPKLQNIPHFGKTIQNLKNLTTSG
jgi:hypothetical protein